MGKRSDRIRAEHEQQMREIADFYRLQQAGREEPTVTDLDRTGYAVQDALRAPTRTRSTAVAR